MAYRFPHNWLFLLALALSVSSVACGNSPIAPGAAIAITSVSPASGSTFGGTTVTISGSGFTAGVAVSIGGIPATQVAVVTAQSVRATTGAHATGPADVVVSLGGRQAVLAGAFTFVAPATGSNAPPDVSALVAQGTRPMQPPNMADLGESIAVSASVTDAETDPSQLTYEWSSTMGSFSGSGSQVTWQAPVALAQTPVDATLTLTVIEHYTEADAQGLPVAKENRVTRTATVSVHDSAREVADLARQFLVLFSQSSVPPDQVLAGFSSDCGNGPSDERSDVEKNRCQYTIDAYRVDTPSVPTFDFDGSCYSPNGARPADACTVVPVHWESTVKSTALSCPVQDPGVVPGERTVTDGLDYVTAVYEQGVWHLCHSDFGATP